MFGEMIIVFSNTVCPYCGKWYRFRYDIAEKEVLIAHQARVTCPYCEMDAVFGRKQSIPKEHLTFKVLE